VTRSPFRSSGAVRSRPDLRSLSHAALQDFVRELGESRYRADQLYRWIHARGAESFEHMTDLTRALRARLAREARLDTLTLAEARTSADGSTKLAFHTADQRVVESVLMPEEREGPGLEGERGGQAGQDGQGGQAHGSGKVSVCVSSQVGCAQGCAFCATARLGLRRSLTSGEIADQLYRIRAWMAQRGDSRRISNVVYMGMGEPLANLPGTLGSLALLMHPLGANLSSRRITVSTAGLVPGLRRLSRASVQVNLAVSLNATTQQSRARLMPIARRYPLDELLDAVRAYPLQKRRRVTWEYVLIAGENDTAADARRLSRLVAGIPSKFNVIAFNPINGCAYRAPPPERVEAFCEPIRRAGYTVVQRQSRGADIAAACGQLAGVLCEPG
jgi:23S rRNA (adenine2503-C2)-methyltransferase